MFMGCFVIQEFKHFVKSVKYSQKIISCLFIYSMVIHNKNDDEANLNFHRFLANN